MTNLAEAGGVTATSTYPVNCPPLGTIAGEAKTGTGGGAGVAFTIIAGLAVLGGLVEGGAPVPTGPSHRELPALDVEPAGQSSQICAPSREYLPSVQIRQFVAPDEEYVPASQLVHVPMDLAPSTVEYVPAPHG
jgi:hypothetical protein